MAEILRGFGEEGLFNIVGGCCGTCCSHIEKIKNVGVYKYNKITAPEAYKDRKEIGVIAQELQEEFPDLVNEETVDPEKTYGLDTILSVDYEHLTAVLLKGMQEQQDQIDSMKKQIEELTSKLNGE